VIINYKGQVITLAKPIMYSDKKSKSKNRLKSVKKYSQRNNSVDLDDNSRNNDIKMPTLI
jgi:hypothetical protein